MWTQSIVKSYVRKWDCAILTFVVVDTPFDVEYSLLWWHAHSEWRPHHGRNGQLHLIFPARSLHCSSCVPDRGKPSTFPTSCVFLYSRTRLRIEWLYELVEDDNYAECLIDVTPSSSPFRFLRFFYFKFSGKRFKATLPAGHLGPNKGESFLCRLFFFCIWRQRDVESSIGVSYCASVCTAHSAAI